MKSILLTCLCLQVALSSLCSTDYSTIATSVDEVTIYHSGALVKRSSSEYLSPGLHELVIESVSSKMILNTFKVKNRNVTVLNKVVVRKLSAEEVQRLEDSQLALTKQLELIETKFNEAGFVSDVRELDQMNAFYSKNVLSIKRELRQIGQKLEEASKLESIELKNKDAAILRLVISIEGRLEGELKFQYVCGGIGWSPSYEIEVDDLSKETLSIKYMGKTMSQTGEDWKNVKVTLSSAFPLDSPLELPKYDEPWVLNGRSNRYDDYDIEYTSDTLISRLDGVDYQLLRIPAVLESRLLNGVFSINSNSTVFTLPIKEFELPANYFHYGFPGIDPDVYLTAEITGWDTLGFVDGVASITYNGNDVGRSLLSFSEAKDTLMIPIGIDNSVYMTKAEIANENYFKSNSSGKKSKTTMAYSIELKNNNSFPVNFILYDQVPISQSKFAEVEILEISSAQLIPETGDVIWNMTLEPGIAIDKKLIFRIETDQNHIRSRSYSRKKYKAISSPRFL